jgi:hypothetical protein
MNNKKSSTTQTSGTADNTVILANCAYNLQPSQAKLASFLNKNIGTELNTFNFRDKGFQNPPQRISELVRFKGALIDKQRGNDTDSAGELHQKVSHYTFYGWGV